jgi:hypothetical protein
MKRRIRSRRQPITANPGRFRVGSVRAAKPARDHGCRFAPRGQQPATDRAPSRRSRILKYQMGAPRGCAGQRRDLDAN